MFEPWIGKHYRDTGLLLLGESSYSWEVDGRKVSPSPQHPQDLVHDIVANFKHQGLGFMRTLKASEQETLIIYIHSKWLIMSHSDEPLWQDEPD
jgi:hypothetical protein